MGEIGEIAGLLGRRGVSAGYLWLTDTGLKKGILDATAPLREYLRDQGFHDYDEQGQGEDYKVVRGAYLVGRSDSIDSRVSLYRPSTKRGDPRIWFKGLGDYASPGNLLAIVAVGDELYALNASDQGLLDTIAVDGSPLARLLSSAGERPGVVAEELLGLLRNFYEMGPVRTVTRGATGVGMTLESLLGIAPNSDKRPDYKGIELKASRRGQSNRVNLFSQIPSWKTSDITDARTLLDRYGYVRKGRLQLYCTVKAGSPNSQGLFLGTRVEEGFLDCLHQGETKFAPEEDRAAEKVVNWYLSKLRERLAQKHAETFWVKSESRGEGEDECHHYVEVVHTRGPILANLVPLLGDGTVTLDFTLSKRPTGTIRDHGYLFKILPENLEALFPPPEIHDLRTGS